MPTNSQIKAARLLVKLSDKGEKDVEPRIREMAALPLATRDLTDAQKVEAVLSTLNSFETNPPPGGWHFGVTALISLIHSALNGEFVE